MASPSPRSGAQLLAECLAANGAETVFGHPGGAILPLYDALHGSQVRHVLARHEQGAGHMAEGYAHASGRTGVAVATSGPGATNLLTPLADAMLDSVPLVAITGQVPTWAVGGDAFQEADTTGASMPFVKHSELVDRPGRIPEAVAEAFHIAGSGRRGPVLLDVPKDVLIASTDASVEVGPVRLPGYRPPSGAGERAALAAAADLLASAERPLLYLGGGTVAAEAGQAVRRLLDATDAPAVTTLMARGIVGDDDPRNLGMPGMHGAVAAVRAMQACDLLVAVGARFDDRVTGDLSAFAPHATVVHIDVDPAEIGKNRRADVGLVADAAAACDALATLLADLPGPDGAARAAWWQRIRGWQARYPWPDTQEPDGPLKPQTVLRTLDTLDLDDRIVVAGVGQHQMWASQLLRYPTPRSWINSGGLGTMGFCVPAAIGAQMARPDATVVAVDGDGGFQMTLQELAVAVECGLPVIFTVLNNGGLGMVRQWQDLFYEQRFHAVDMGAPDLTVLAAAYGIPAWRCDDPGQVAGVFAEALEVRARQRTPVLLEFVCDPHENVFPMVPAGASNDAIIPGPDLTVGPPAGGRADVV